MEALPVLAYFIGATGIKFVTAMFQPTSRPQKAKPVGTVSKLLMYPLKSCQQLSLNTVQCTAQGVKHPLYPVFDRTLVVIDNEGKYISGKDEPKITILEVSINETHMQIKDPTDNNTFQVVLDHNLLYGDVHSVSLFGTSAQGVDLGPEAAKWISQVFGKPDQYRLLFNTKGCEKRDLSKILEQQFYPWTSRAGTGQDRIGFQNSFPFMLASEASLNDVNSRLQNPVSMKNMRPNIVVSGCKAFQEESWSEIWIGDVKFSNVKPCARCPMTLIDPEKGEKRTDNEPLKTMRTYRISNPHLVKPIFGVCLVLDSEEAVISVGDPVYIIPEYNSF